MAVKKIRRPRGGPGSTVTTRRGGLGLSRTPSNSFYIQLARRYKAMRKGGVVKDSGSTNIPVHSPRGHGGPRGTHSTASVTTKRKGSIPLS